MGTRLPWIGDYWEECRRSMIKHPLINTCFQTIDQQIHQIKSEEAQLTAVCWLPSRITQKLAEHINLLMKRVQCKIYNQPLLFSWLYSSWTFWSSTLWFVSALCRKRIGFLWICIRQAAKNKKSAMNRQTCLVLLEVSVPSIWER